MAEPGVSRRMQLIRHARAVLAVVPLALAAVLSSSSVALADCAMPKPIDMVMEEAEIVFVGTVTAVANRNTWATVTIEEIWKGPDQEATVIVKGGPGGNAATSVDRAFEVGVKYLFFPEFRPDPEPGLNNMGLNDNSCTSTQPWTAELVALRPADARAPLPAPTESSGFDVAGLIAPLGVALVVAVVLLGAGLLARGRQST